MFELHDEEIDLISGGDAAVTRLPGQNSWGEWSDGTIRDIIFYYSRLNP